jgi:uncharacterized protein (DUF302 family)
MRTKFAKTVAFSLIMVVLSWGIRAMAADGLITLRSDFGPEATRNRLETEVRARGMTIFAQIDHAAAAASVGLSLQPTYLLIFGAAKGGTPLMQSVQTVGIDLPLKVLIWQDAAGTTFLSYNDPAYLVHRHNVGESAKPAVEALAGVLTAIAAAVTKGR